MKLLEPLAINHMALKNRVMFPPMTTGYEDRAGSITDQSVNFYRRLAQGGVAYVVVGDVSPVHTISPTPKLVTDEQIPSFARLADALHEFDCKLGLQVFHPEYDTVAVAELFRAGDMQGARAKLMHDMKHYVNEVTAERLQEILGLITALAERCVKAGVDAIEVHGDRLVGSLCSPLINQRDDEFGGSFENRTRFALEVVRAIRAGAPDICIDYKLPIITENPQIGRGGLFIDEAVRLAKLLEEAGVDTFHVGQANHTGNMNDTIPVMGTRPYCFMEDYARQVKEAVSVPVSTVGRIIMPEDAERMIEEGACDYVGLGRSLLCDPDYVRKLEAGTPELIRHCMMCNKGCTDAIQNRRFLSCVLNAENGYEYERVIEPAAEAKKVAVVGAGPAGMEAARVAALRGHEVTLFEACDELGGQLTIACVPPRKSEMGRSIDWWKAALEAAGVDVRLGAAVGARELAEAGFDAVIVAVGGKNAWPRIEGIGAPFVVDSWDVLRGTRALKGNVAVIGGGLVGAETAEYIANAMPECHVTVVEMADKVAAQESNTVLPAMMADFQEHGVELLTGAKVAEFVENPGYTPAVVVEVAGGEGAAPERREIPCNFAVLALGTSPVSFDATPLEEAGIPVTFVGDCHEVAAIDEAVTAGYLAACAL
ncbi:MAG TPA: NAD(P)/FAD-dependent oxidoreductase [Slackia equolifaciens]|uniref:NAD(P)/FAD-dependent oxidoreductase n=1 Tax=Slackia equolifaciens TaxID=498718 RepID=A0A9D3A0V2_9ACTN|nr:NAD(P)/FAD-dependent oxidoreductase [Slackia equolifaciens]